MILLIDEVSSINTMYLINTINNTHNFCSKKKLIKKIRSRTRTFLYSNKKMQTSSDLNTKYLNASVYRISIHRTSLSDTSMCI